MTDEAARNARKLDSIAAAVQGLAVEQAENRVERRLEQQGATERYEGLIHKTDKLEQRMEKLMGALEEKVVANALELGKLRRSQRWVTGWIAGVIALATFAYLIYSTVAPLLKGAP